VSQPDRSQQIPPHIQRHFDSHSRSKLTIRAYCKRASLSPWTFYTWRKRYSSNTRTSLPARFEEVAMPIYRQEGCEVCFPSGVRLRIPARFPAHELRGVVEVLLSVGNRC